MAGQLDQYDRDRQKEKLMIDKDPARKSPNPYARAKKKDPKLDSYIKARNNAEKGSSEYNAAQNKINKAYGKGPTNRPTAKGKVATIAKKSAAPVMSSSPKPTLKKLATPKAPAPAPATAVKRKRSKVVATGADRADRRSERRQDRAKRRTERKAR